LLRLPAGVSMMTWTRPSLRRGFSFVGSARDFNLELLDVSFTLPCRA